MASFSTYLQGASPTEIEATDIAQFAGAGGFDSAIIVAEYNDTSHVKTSGGSDKSASNTPNNVKFISQSGGTGGDSEADWGDGTEDIDAITDAEATFNINFSDASSVVTESAIFYAFDGTTPATAPANVSVKCAEVGDANFTDAEGSASALDLADQGASTSHDFYILVSVSPDTVGLKDAFAFAIELTYS